jgi:hypothetical protein
MLLLPLVRGLVQEWEVNRRELVMKVVVLLMYESGRCCRYQSKLEVVEPS